MKEFMATFGVLVCTLATITAFGYLVYGLYSNYNDQPAYFNRGPQDPNETH